MDSSFPASQVAIQNKVGVFGFGLLGMSQKIRIDKIAITNQGSVYGDFLRNFRLMDGASQIGSAVYSMDKMKQVVFDLSANPLYIDKGVMKGLKVEADITGGVGYTFQFGIIKSTDITAYDSQYGVFIKPNGTDSWQSIIVANASTISQ